jgi:hypothetical protein
VKKLGVEVDELGFKKTYYADGEGGLIIETAQDVTPIIEANKAQYNSTDERKRWGDGWEKVGSIPLTMIQKLNELGICKGFAIVDQKKMKAFLNDPENRYLRTRPGRV